MALLGTLVDDFAGAALDTSLWTVPTSTGTATVTGGSLRLNAPTLDNASWPQVVTRSQYTIAGSSIVVRVRPFVSTYQTYTGIELTTPGGLLLTFRYNSLSGWMERRVNTGSFAALAAYNAVSMAFWRIAMSSGGATTFDVSPDGKTWTNAATSNLTAANYSSVTASLFLQNASAGVNATSYFDAVNPTNAITAAITAGINDTDASGTPTVSFVPSLAPIGINDGQTIDNPAAQWTLAATPGDVADPEAAGEPTASSTPLPDTITDREALGTPDVAFAPGTLYPDSIIDLGPVGAPTAQITTYYTGGYGTGLYGQGLYGTFYISPDSNLNAEILQGPTLGTTPTTAPAGTSDGEQLGTPALGGTALPEGPHPLEIGDPETLGQPSVTVRLSGLYGQGLYGQGLYGQGQAAGTVTLPDESDPRSNYDYGMGTYGEGPYYGTAVAGPTDNPTYGSGTYGYGLYYGIPRFAEDAIPLLRDIAGQHTAPLHILGIGPWSPVIQWRGAANYDIRKGNQPARPRLPLPAATSKGFTLRLNDASEARADLILPRGSALVIDEMDTDLWWRRKEFRTGAVEMIGRFNTSHVNLSSSDNGIAMSLQFDDYRTILGARMVLRYLHPDWDTSVASQWPKGSKLTDILAWALPKNTRIDYSEVTGDNPYPLGVTTSSYTLPPGTTIDDLMDGLNAISGNKWEWWVDTPNNINEAPKLRFQLGTRGTDRGVVLFDLGKGPTPIQSWTRNAAADNYANSILYTGGEGSLVETMPAQIVQYGQRDAAVGNSSIPGTEIALMRARARQKLAKLASRAATYTIRLDPGFWRGRQHIDVGDTIRIVLRLGKEVIDEEHRVTEINVDIDENSFEEVTLTLGTPLPSPDPRSKRAPLQRLVRYLREYNAPTGQERVITEDE